MKTKFEFSGDDKPLTLNVVIQPKELDKLADCVADKVIARLGGRTDDILSVREAAELLGVSESSVRLLIKGNADFPYTRLGKKIRIVKSSLIGWLKAKNYVFITDFNGFDDGEE